MDKSTIEETTNVPPVIEINTEAPCDKCGNKGAMQSGICLQCAADYIVHSRTPEYLKVLHASEVFPIPEKEDFGDQQFLPAPDLSVIGKMLIDKYHDFDHLTNLNANIVYLWKSKGGESGGRAILGKCVSPSGLVDYFACQAETAVESRSDKVDFVIWAAADHLRNNRAKFHTVCALVFHELKHTAFDEKGNLIVQGHEFEGFAREIEEFGMWKRDIKIIAEACESIKDVQLGLFSTN